MPKFKPHKTVEQIAKKHRLDVSFIQKQLDMGEPIEHEHTKDHKLARDIALQHLDEIPDYYTRLKKMEASAKKEHKKFKDVKESHNGEEMRFCPLCDKKETRSECSYGEKAWDKVSIKDEEYSMARSELKTIEDALKRLSMKVGKGEGNLEAWVQSKITKAADYIDTAADYVNSGEMEESIGFTINSSTHNTAKKREKIRTLATRTDNAGEKEVAKRKLGPVAELPSIKTEEKLVDKIVDEMKCWPGYKKKGTQTLFGKKYNRCVKAEDVSIEDAEGNTFAEVVDIIKPEPIKGFKSQIEEAKRLQAQTGNIVLVTLSWRGKYYGIKMFFPQTKVPSRKEIGDEIQKVYPGSLVVHHSVSEIEPGKTLIQPLGPQGGNYGKLGPSRGYIKPMGEEVELDEDWQKVNRKDKTDGMSQDAVDKYRNENRGSKLKTAVTTPPSELKPGSADWKRRKNFCSRSRSWTGERGKAARKRWNCN
jgi:hypothetical protein